MANHQLFDLTGRNVLVSGAGRGLGAAMSEALASFGANVAVFDLGDESTSTTVQNVTAQGGKSFYITGDVRDLEACQRAVDAVVSSWGSLDVLVNNAGIALNGPAESIELSEVRTVFDIDVFAMLQLSQVAFEPLVASGHGCVINIASIAGMSVLRPQKHIGYNAAKAAVVMLTKTMAVEWASSGVRVNAIAPGYMMSPAVELVKSEHPDFYEEWMAKVPMERPGEPAELGGTAVYLASDASSYVTGSVLVVDGGYTST
jgi:NAD(P)-dependent dehydrogenase (short-subunit alcohol dehydrogenase family)